MRKKIVLPKRKSVFILCFLAMMMGCIKNFEDINTDPTRLVSLEPEDIRRLFSNALYNGVAAPNGAPRFQTGQNLFADHYAQYYAGTQTAFASHRYTIVQNWVQDHWINTYIATMPSLYFIINETAESDFPTLNAIARIWKVFVLHRTTDYFGPIPYSQIGSTEKTIDYDAQRDIYFDFFNELNAATIDLQNNIDRPSYGDQDLIYNGNNELWLKFANTLRLRLALRISNVEPEKAKQEAEAAVANGVLVDYAEDAYLAVSTNNRNTLAYISSWNEFRMSASMESLLKGYNDPRLSRYFQPAVMTGEYRGVRNGMMPAEQMLPENDYDHSSNVAERFTPEFMAITPMSVMYAAEAYLLRAEGALNGWNMGGTAEELYEKGIEMSLRTHGVTNGGVISDYIAGTSLPAAPGGYFNTPALTDIPVRFDTNPEKQREQILTQKWLALFPDGYEAWAEVRRSGYPKLYALVHSDNPNVPANTMIRRIPFVNYDRDRNGPAVKAAEALLDGPDDARTPLWWDTNGEIGLVGAVN